MSKHNKPLKLSSNDYLDKIKQYGRRILSIVSNNYSKDKNFEKFTDIFHSYISIDYLKQEKIEFFSEILKDSYSFLKSKTDKNKLALSNDITLDGKGFLVLKLLTDNKPYIVDSLKALLSKMNLEAEYIFYPTIPVIREGNGKLKDIYDRNSNNTYTTELLIFIRIYGVFSKEILNQLEVSIKDILYRIEQITEAWLKILDNMDKLCATLKSIPPRVDKLLENNAQEVNDLIIWLKNDNFTFLGYLDYKLTKPTKSQTHNITQRLGIVSTVEAKSEEQIYEIIDLSIKDEHRDKLVLFGKINQYSPINKYSNISFILIKQFNQEGEYNRGAIILGHYSSPIYYQSVTSIPCIRNKLQDLMNQSSFSRPSYNYSKLRAVFESLPRDELFYLDKQELLNISMEILSAINTKTLKIFATKDLTSHFVSVLLFLPSERLVPEIIEQLNNYIAAKFCTKILNSYYEVVAQHFKIFSVTLSGQNIDLDKYDLSEIKQELEVLTCSWKDSLLQELTKTYGKYEAPILSKIYYKIFSKDYRQKFSAYCALQDLSYIKQTSQHPATTVFNLNIANENNINLKIFNAENKLPLSRIIPYLENIGFTVLEEQTFIFNESQHTKQVFLHIFNLSCNLPKEANLNILKLNVEEALSRMVRGMLNNEPICKLIILAVLNWRQITILEALTKYLQQTGFIYANNFVQQTLIQHPEFAKLIYSYYDYKFNPEEHSIKKAQEVHSQLLNYLNSVTNSNEDKVLRALLNIINAIVRTNSYQKTEAGEFKTYISFKFNSALVPHLPLPKPYAEIFVYSKEFEAIHLRGGPVARGGIRWSDRGEDYRTEVLGLMKAQMTKNTVIVPVGSKGGFFIKFSSENLSRADFIAKVVNSYCDFLRGLLDLTCNMIRGKIINPPSTIIYDDNDPYLVVAADKGTATFSDYANKVSKEYKYWLGDAFASGGSVGYDHKKMGITARGAWIAVKRHFQEMGINPESDPIRVVGIGDMAGDVFGNGMLLSKSLKLVAAFNHIHIFLDPDPNPNVSYKERKRLFELPGSKWSDYNHELISKGGGVFERKAKSIPLTTEVKKLLNLNSDQATPEEIIQAMLKTDVDLIWNGGIGTYIKASTENNIDIGDKANDNVRVNGCDVKARVIGEGGNLGVSQRGRIEYSKHGGRINTDFIDNSAGVDCSDHEVNIKIALGRAMIEGKLNLADRDKILSEMTDEVTELVLYDNFKQTQSITINEKSLAFTTELFARQIEQLELEGLLDRKVEFLPSANELSKMAQNHEKLTRPELAVLLSYSKMSVYKELLQTKLVNEKFFEKYLIEYFPKRMQEQFNNAIISHELRKEIIITVITNKIVNQLGGAIISSIKRETGAHLCDIVRAYTIITEIFNLESLWDKVEKLANKVEIDIIIEMFTEINKVTRRGIFWFVRNFEHPLNISKLINEYHEHAIHLGKILYKSLKGDASEKFKNKVLHLKEHQVPDQLAHEIAALDSFISALDVISIANKTEINNEIVAKTYFEVGSYFKLDWLRKNCDKLIDSSYWNRLSIQSIKDDLYDKQRIILRTIIKQMKKLDNNFSLMDWNQINSKHAEIYNKFIKEISEQENLDLNMIVLATKKLKIFLQSL